MLNEIFKFLLQHFPQIALFVAVVVITVMVTVRVIRVIERIKKLEGGCDGCKTESLPQMSKKLDDIRYMLNSVIVYLNVKDKNLNIQLFKSNSPIQLTDLGFKVLEVCGGKHIIDSNIDKFISDIDQKQFKTALDVHEFAPMLMLDYFNNTEVFNSVKDYMYKNPIYKVKTGDLESQVSMDTHNITMVMGIYLRNKYLAKYPELEK